MNEYKYTGVLNFEVVEAGKDGVTEQDIKTLHELDKPKRTPRTKACKDCSNLKYDCWKCGNKGQKLKPGYKCLVDLRFKPYTGKCDNKGFAAKSGRC